MRQTEREKKLFRMPKHELAKLAYEAETQAGNHKAYIVTIEQTYREQVAELEGVRNSRQTIKEDRDSAREERDIARRDLFSVRNALKTTENLYADMTGGRDEEKIRSETWRKAHQALADALTDKLRD